MRLIFRGLRIMDCRALARRRPEIVYAQVIGNAAQPTTQRSLVLERVIAAVKAQVGLLDQVFRSSRVPDLPEYVAVKPGPMLLE